MQDCSETLVEKAIIDIWTSVENVKTLGIAEKFEIYIYIYIYIYNIFLTYFYSYSITCIIP